MTKNGITPRTTADGSAVTTVKRGRGRPRKNNNSNTNNLTEESKEPAIESQDDS